VKGGEDPVLGVLCRWKDKVETLVILELVGLLSKRKRLKGDEVEERLGDFKRWEGRGCSFPQV
jgi:hypothetical protein